MTGSNIEIEIPSAQIKSGIILASLNAQGTTNIVEHNITRDHTEIMLESFNADIECFKDNDKKHIRINGKRNYFLKIYMCHRTYQVVRFL